MTKNKRIFLNIMATYGRSLYGFVLGIITARWAFQALGESDYGLMGLVGGIVGFITFFNGILSGSLARYYAIAVGEEEATGVAGLERCRMWFTTGVVIHTVVPLVLMIIGYPIGEWAVRHYLTIPADRISECVWVWRCVCVTTLISMVTVPINAMYGAKQYIAELTIYSVVVSTVNAFFLHYMVTHPRVWLVPLAIWNSVMAILPGSIITLRALCIFEECRFRWRYVYCWKQIKDICSFSFWVMFSSFGVILRSQGISVLVNKYYGPKVNAGMAVGNSLAGHSETLSGSLIGAFSPAIYNAWGAGQKDYARALAYRVCKIGTFLVMIFAIPLALEAEEVLRLWLKTPPEYAAMLCVYVMVMAILDKLAYGQMILLNANGKIAKYTIFLSPVVIATMPIAWVMMALGVGVKSVGLALNITILILVIGRQYFAETLAGMDWRYWLRCVVRPLLIVGCAAALSASVPRLMMVASFGRVVCTTVCAEVVLLPLAWLLVLGHEEKLWVMKQVDKVLRRR